MLARTLVPIKLTVHADQYCVSLSLVNADGLTYRVWGKNNFYEKSIGQLRAQGYRQGRILCDLFGIPYEAIEDAKAVDV